MKGDCGSFVLSTAGVDLKQESQAIPVKGYTRCGVWKSIRSLHSPIDLRIG